MLNSSWQGLLEDLAILAILVSIWTLGSDWIEAKPRWIRELLGCVLAAGGVVLLMITPLELQRGITIDLRYSLIGLAGLLASPLIGIVTGLAAAACRIYLGGIGALSGVTSIAIATIVGFAGGRLLRGRAATVRDLLLLAAACSILPLAGIFALPFSLILPVFVASVPPLIAMTFLGVMLAGLAVIEADRRRETATINVFYRSIIDALPEPLNAKDLQGRFLAANPATANQLGAPDVAAVLGRTDFDFHPLEVARRFRADEERILARGEAETIEQVLEHEDGSRAWLSTLKSPLRNRAGAIIGLLTHNRDITERKRLEEAVEEGRRRLMEATDHMADGLVMFNKDARIVLCNERYRAMFPLTADLRVPGARLEDILRAAIARGEQTDVPEGAVDVWVRQVIAGLAHSGERDIHLADGRWVAARRRPTANGGSLSVLVDITQMKRTQETLTEANERLLGIASEDSLTGLPNRRAYDAALQRAFGQSRRNGSPLSLLMIDVDHFKAYNDTYGHPAGDDCLRTIGNMLRIHLRRPSDVAARYGGEEFVAILPDTPADGARHCAETVRRSILALGMEHAGTKFGVVTVSIGVTTMTAETAFARGEELTARADAALYAAKSAGRNRVAAVDAPEPNRPLAKAS